MKAKKHVSRKTYAHASLLLLGRLPNFPLLLLLGLILMILTFLTLPHLIVALLHSPTDVTSKTHAIASETRCTNPAEFSYGFLRAPVHSPG